MGEISNCLPIISIHSTHIFVDEDLIANAIDVAEQQRILNSKRNQGYNYISLGRVLRECEYLLSDRGADRKLVSKYEEILSEIGGELRDREGSRQEWRLALARVIDRWKAKEQVKESAILISDTQNNLDNESFCQQQYPQRDQGSDKRERKLAKLNDINNNNKSCKELIWKMYDNLDLIEDNVQKLGVYSSTALLKQSQMQQQQSPPPLNNSNQYRLSNRQVVDFEKQQNKYSSIPVNFLNNTLKSNKRTSPTLFLNSTQYNLPSRRNIPNQDISKNNEMRIEESSPMRLHTDIDVSRISCNNNNSSNIGYLNTQPIDISMERPNSNSFVRRQVQGNKSWDLPVQVNQKFNSSLLNNENNNIIGSTKADTFGSVYISKNENERYNGLDFSMVEGKITLLSKYFSRLLIYCRSRRSKKSQRNKILSLENQAHQLNLHQLLEKSFYLLKGFAAVNRMSKNKARNISELREYNLKRKYLFLFQQQFRIVKQQNMKISWMDSRIKQRRQAMALTCLQFYNKKMKYRRQMLGQISLSKQLGVQFILDHIWRFRLGEQNAPSILDDNLIRQCVDNQLIPMNNLGLLQRQQSQVILAILSKCFNVFKSLVNRNKSASCLRTYKLLSNSFNSLSQFALNKRALKQRLEEFISKRLQFLCNDDQIYKYLIDIMRWQLSFKDGGKSPSHLQLHNKNHRLYLLNSGKGYCKINQQNGFTYSTIVQQINFFNQLIIFYYFQQSEKSKQIRAIKHYYKMMCSKVLISLDKNRLISQSNQAQNNIAYSYLKVRTTQVALNQWKQWTLYKQQCQQKENIIKKKAGKGCMQRALRLWRLELSYAKIVRFYKTERAFNKFKKAVKAEQAQSQQKDAIIQEFRLKHITRKAVGAFQVLAGMTEYYAANYRNAFSFQYNRLLQSGFTGLKDHLNEQYYKHQIAQQHYVKNNQTLMWNILYAWRVRTKANEGQRWKNKMAIKCYIKKLFVRFITILSNNVQQSKIKRHKSNLAILFKKNLIWKKWRKCFICKLIYKHFTNKIQSKAFKALSEYTNTKRIKHLKEKKADEKYMIKLGKQAHAFVEALKMRREKTYFMKLAVQNTKTILNKKQKMRIFVSLKQIVKASKITQNKINFIQNKINLKLLCNSFNIWKDVQERKRQNMMRIRQILKQKIRKQISYAIDRWRVAVDEIETKKEIQLKSQFLRDTLSKRRLFTSLKRHSLNIAMEQEQLIRAEEFRRKQLFQTFVRVFYHSIALKKQKMIATRHYASQLLVKSFGQWKQFSTAIYEERYQKADFLQLPYGKENINTYLLKNSTNFSDKKTKIDFSLLNHRQMKQM